jgi:hypothetical protein
LNDLLETAVIRSIANCKWFSILLLALTALPLASNAHHSAVAFDRSKTMTVSGKVTKFVWRNPHMSISAEITKDDGSTELWLIEGGSTTEMVNTGFTRDSLAVGDEITLAINPLRSGRPGGLLTGLMLADGTSYGMPDAYTEREQTTARQIPSLTPYVPPPPGETWQKREARTRPAQLPLIPDNANALMGALDPENLAKPHPKPAFDLTGTWAFRGERSEQAHYGTYEFKPHPEFTEKGKQIYDEYLSYATQGKRYTEPTAFCYPAGMPRVMTRFGSLMMLQYPTAIFMVSRLNNEYRVISRTAGRGNRPIFATRTGMASRSGIGTGTRWSSKPKASPMTIT